MQIIQIVQTVDTLYKEKCILNQCDIYCVNYTIINLLESFIVYPKSTIGHTEIY